jgi:uncharacterized protein (DUF1800 family)
VLKEFGPGGWAVVEVQDYNGLQQEVKWRSRHHPPLLVSTVGLTMYVAGGQRFRVLLLAMVHEPCTASLINAYVINEWFTDHAVE